MTDSVFELPEISAEAAPEFTDLVSCKAWLEHVPLADRKSTRLNSSHG